MSSNTVKTFTVIMFMCSILSCVKGDSNKVCRLDDRRNTAGVCKPLTACPAVLGLLRAGVKPTRCSSSSQGPAIVCCPSTKRISSEKCDEYMKVLTQPIKAKEAIVFNGKHSEQNSNDGTIKCESFYHEFITGGANATFHQFPYQVALGYGETPDWRCGGTLIDPSYILTAAHCVRTIFGPPKVALLGDIILSTKHDASRIQVNVSDIYVYPKYQSPMQYNDIALIKLEYPVPLSRAILPACLPNPSDRLDRAIGVEATGWGRTGAFDQQSDILKSVTLAKFDVEECASFFRDNGANKERLPKGIIQSQFCAGDKHGFRDTCQGDSGGPVTVENKDYSCVRYLVGITSFGSTLCGYQQPGVYTNVLSYLDWIEDIVWRNLSAKEKSKLYTKVTPPDSHSHHRDDGLIFKSTTALGHNSISETYSTTHMTQSTTTPSQTLTPFLTRFPANPPSFDTIFTVPPFKTPLDSDNLYSTERTATILPPFPQLNEGYNFFNISSTIADLLNSFSLGR